MSNHHSQSAGVAGLCILACAAMVLMVGVMQAFRAYAPAVREFLLWAITPQFAMGMFSMAFLTSLCVLALARVKP